VPAGPALEVREATPRRRPAADHGSQLWVGARWSTLGVHGGTNRLQRRERISDPGSAFLVRSRLTQRVQRLPEVISTALDVGPSSAGVRGCQSARRFGGAHRVMQS
jgi:hypothetical protein